MKTQTVRKTAQAKKGSATKVVRRKAAETEDDDDTRVKKMVQVRRVLSSINKKEMGYLIIWSTRGSQFQSALRR